MPPQAPTEKPRTVPGVKYTTCGYILPVFVALGGCASDQSVGCTAAKVAEVPLQPAGQIFLVPVSVNGHTLQMILDTGAQKSVLTEFAVQKWHIPQSGRTFTVGVGNLGGSMRSDAGTCQRL